MNTKFSGFCVIGTEKDRSVIITSLSLFKHKIKLITTDVPAKFNWSDKDLVKLVKSKSSAVKLMWQICESQFIKLFSDVQVAEIQIDTADKQIQLNYIVR